MILKSIFVLLFYCYIGVAQGRVRLQSSGPTVIGANLTLSASLTFGYRKAQYKYVFRCAENEQSVEIFSSGSVVNHTVKISRDKYDVGLYAFEVRVYGKVHRRRTYSLIGQDRLRVSVTDLLNGKLKLVQNGFDRSYGRIFANERVNHVIELSKEEQYFLTDDNTYIVHWYIDCSLISSAGLSFDYAYENKYKTYNLEALIEVEHGSRVFDSTSNPIPAGLSGFKCAPVHSFGYTYGYYKASVRTDATDGSPPPPRASSERPSSSEQDSGSLASTSATSVNQPHYGENYFTVLSSGPTVLGANLTLSVVILDSYPSVERKFVFLNLDKGGRAEFTSSELVMNYTLKLSKDKYEPGNYRFEVQVSERNTLYHNIYHYKGSQQITVPVSATDGSPPPPTSGKPSYFVDTTSERVVHHSATDGSPPPPTSGKPSYFYDTASERVVYPSGGDKGQVKLQSSGPTVRGAYLTLSATFVDGYSGVERKYVFRNVEKGENIEIFSKESVVTYSLKLHKMVYKPGSYRFEVRVYVRNEDDPDTFRYLSKDGIRVPVTDLLNGKLKMIQNGFDRSYGRIFPNERVSYLIELSQEEQKFLTDGNRYLVYWYLDCSLVSSTGLQFNHTYEERYKTYVLEALVEVEHNPYSAAGRAISKVEKLKSFKCAPVHNAGYTYGYYKINVRTDATDGSPPPPSATPEIPSSIWQDSRSPDSDTGFQPFSTTPKSVWRDQDRHWHTSPAPNSFNVPWRNWRTTERYTNTFNSGDHKNCTSNANNAVISIKDGHLKIAMDLVFKGTVNITNFQIERN